MSNFFVSVRESIEDFFHRFNERRQHPRKKKVYLADIEFSGKRMPVTIINLSRQGIGICSEEKLGKDTSVVVIFSHLFSTGKHKGMKIELKLPGKVVWSKSVADRPDGQHSSPKGGSSEYDTGIVLEDVPAAVSALYYVLLNELAV
jgi:hypothetical protein